jgi:hypothetical protein
MFQKHIDKFLERRVLLQLFLENIMPVIAVNLSQKTYADIMTLVMHGGYSGPEQFLEIAAFNQLALERGLTPEELLKKIHKPAVEDSVPKTKPGKDRGRIEQKSVPVDRGRKVHASKQRFMATEVSDEELQTVLSRFSAEACKTLTVACCSAGDNAGRERIWGQVNRLFPVKAACRWIGVVAASGKNWPELHSISDKLPVDAGVLGSALEKADTENERKREEMVGTGLPRKGNLQSSDRFLSQFIARVTRANRIYPGVISQYGLACFSGDKVQLTKAGFELACLQNPILDEDFGMSRRTLSEEEREFLLKHIWERVPMEKQDFVVLLKSIADGNDKPESLMSATRTEFPKTWTDVAFRTHIYGVLARSAELGVLTKHWEGRTVKYGVSKSARSLLAA